MKKLLLIFSTVLIASLSLWASESETDKYYNTVQVDFVGTNNTKVPMQYPIKKRKDGAWRVRIPKEDLVAETILAVDIKIPASFAKKGEEGYFI